MQKYIGIKMVEAEPMTQLQFLKEKGDAFVEVGENVHGYRVQYADGYTSWCPKEQFEKANLPLADEAGDVLLPEDIIGFVDDVTGITTSKMGEKTCVVQAKCLTGFEITDSAACVNPDNYDHLQGTNIALERIKDKLWGHLGFVLQWARFGLKQ